MAARLNKKESTRASARAIARRLDRLRGEISERQWTIEAGVSPSFFSNLRGTPTKPPSDPGVDQLRQVLGVRGVTLAEFFLAEARGRVVSAPARRVVEQAFEDALAELPSKASVQPRYLAEVVASLLALPAALPAIEPEEGPEAMGEHTEGAPLRRATKRK